ncbi:MAG: hypothetical protein COA66_06440 [Arcobacter sp.]|nr:MAG: hypothetical protein COA66_06440 [Arcobacter sp.]
MYEHGSYKIKVINQTIIVECFDSWNIETVLRFCKEYKEMVEEIKYKPWACLVDLSQWELSTPDMWDEIYKLNEWSNDKNQKYEAVICSLSLQEILVANSHKAFINVESNFFKNIDQACNWLTSVGVLNIEEASCLMVGKEEKESDSYS